MRPTPDARVSTPLKWDEVPEVNAEDFNLKTVPERFARLGDPAAAIDERAGSLDSLLELGRKQGQGDAPWPPHYAKQEGEPPRVAPSRRRKS